MNRPTQEFVDEVTKKLAEDGKLIEAGWVGYTMLVIPQSASPAQIEETRLAFFAGAQHLFGSLTTMMEPDAEPTEKDMARMHNIDRELKAFLEEFKNRHHGGQA